MSQSAKTYYGIHTKSTHTYEFYYKRRDNPKWHDDYIYVKGIVRRETIRINIILFVTASIFIGLLGYLYFQSNSQTSNTNIPESSSMVSSSSQ